MALARLLPALVFAANLALAAVFAQLVISGVFPWSHHWIFPVMAALILAQTFGFRRTGPVAGFVAANVVLLAVAAARLETIRLSHHLIHFALAYAIGAVTHRQLARWDAGPGWASANRRWARTLAFVAVGAALLALRDGIWWGLRDGT